MCIVLQWKKKIFTICIILYVICCVLYMYTGMCSMWDQSPVGVCSVQRVMANWEGKIKWALQTLPPPPPPATDCKMHYHAEGGAICTYLKSMQPLLLSFSASLNRNGNSLWDQYLSVIIKILVICTSEQWYTYSDSESEQWYVYATQWI